MDKIKIKYPIIVEGKYDKSTLLSTFDTLVITTGGFSVFNSKEKQSLIRKIGEKGIILLTDSDGGGKQIRSFLHSVLPGDLVFDAYIPKIKGKERRKTAPSKAGLLGVEGVSIEVLKQALAPFAVANGDSSTKLGDISAFDMYRLGLSGSDGASQLRARLLSRLALPQDMSAKAALAALNMLLNLDALEQIMADIQNV
ncbi:MAG: DUF4093 domain-containing protein [Clostridia bacterium]|nr:DUF4093 domain-containing protein [Clostridia bacterium]